MVEEVEGRASNLQRLTLLDMEALVDSEVRIKVRGQAEVATSLAIADLADLRRGEAVEVDVLIGLEPVVWIAGGDGEHAVEGRAVEGRGADGVTQRRVLDGQAEVLAGVRLHVAAGLPRREAGERPTVHHSTREEVVVDRRTKVEGIRGVDDLRT